MDTLRGLIQETGHMYRRASILGSIAPIVYQTVALGIVMRHRLPEVLGTIRSPRTESFSSSCCDPSATARPSRARSRASAPLRACSRTSCTTSIASTTLESPPMSTVPESFEVDFDSVEYSYDGMTLALGGITHADPGGEDRRHARTLGQRQDDHQPDSCWAYASPRAVGPRSAAWTRRRSPRAMRTTSWRSCPRNRCSCRAR